MFFMKFDGTHSWTPVVHKNVNISEIFTFPVCTAQLCACKNHVKQKCCSRASDEQK